MQPALSIIERLEQNDHLVSKDKNCSELKGRMVLVPLTLLKNTSFTSSEDEDPSDTLKSM